MFDQFVSARTLDKYPQMYKMGQASTFYNHKVFFGWIVNSFMHSLGLFYFWAWAMGDGDILQDGRTIDNWAFGTMVYTSTLFTVLIKHCLIADTFTALTHIAFFGSPVLFILLFPLV